MGSWSAAEVASEIDRLVLAVNQTVDDVRLSDAAGDRVLDWIMLSQLGDFMLAGELTEEIAALRSPYRPRDVVLGRLHDLEQQGLIERGGLTLAATHELRPLIETLMEARGDAAASMWRGREDDVEPASATARKLGELVSDDHTVAAVHRTLPAPDDRYLRLHSRLLTLRYVRQHDHVEAWGAHGLTAPAAVAMTGLWQGEAVGPGAGLVELVSRGLASDDPLELTDDGRRMRDAIETETNERAQVIFAELGDDESAEFLTVLRRLPG